MAKGVVNFGKGWKVDEIRQCHGHCKKPMRHRMADYSLHPETVRHLGDGLCDSCHQIMKPRKTKRPSPEMQAVMLQEALAVRDAIRKRRERLGITPDGRRLPRRVDAG